MKLDESDHLQHYGILRRSGRYPWGSGNNSATIPQRSAKFLDTINKLRAEGMKDKDIAKGFSTKEHPFTINDIRALTTIANDQLRQDKLVQMRKLQDKGLSRNAIAQKMGMNESTLRGLEKADARNKVDSLQNTANMLRRQVEEKGAIDIGTQVERSLPLGDNPAARIGVTSTKFRTAVAMLKEEGYVVHTVKVRQAGTGEMTKNLVLAKPDVKWRDLVLDPGKIKPIAEFSEDGGRNWEGFKPPINIPSHRIKVVYKEEGGDKADGIIYIRPGAKDLDMGRNRYAQVRIAVDGTHYLKGMAVLKDDMPHGVDIMFNTNKSSTGNKMDAMKPMEKGPDGRISKDFPFGSVVRQRKDASGKVVSALNIIGSKEGQGEEGSWDNWTRSLPSQMLSKQPRDLIKTQLDRTHERRLKEFDEIMSLQNATVKKKLLETFADETDSAAVHLKAAAIPRQRTQVILPVNSLKPHEVYAPNFKHGEQVALVRFPHGGTFEIPLVTVNNRNREARKTLGTDIMDAIGIHHTVAERLSGADFDGDTVLVIPNSQGRVVSTHALEGLKNYDPKRTYAPYDGMKTIDGGKWNEKTKTVDYPRKPDGNLKVNKSTMQQKMGDVSNLITDMTIKGANTDEIARAVRHSMTIIDAEKHHLDYKTSERENGIPALKKRYQGKANAGAATLLSKAGAPERIPRRKLRPAKEGGPIDPRTGAKRYVETGESYTNKKGEVVRLTQTVKKLALTDDAHTLSSGNPIERIYADHSNRLKALANQARKESLPIKGIKKQPSAAKVYTKEVASLESKLNDALLNAPLERTAQRLTDSVVSQKRQANPQLDESDIKKIRNQALAEMRMRTGARKQRVTLTQEEWNAIQAGAISNNKLVQILRNADMDSIRQHATPKERLLMSGSKLAQAKAMLARGYTQAEVADHLGVSLTTLKSGITEGGG